MSFPTKGSILLECALVSESTLETYNDSENVYDLLISYIYIIDMLTFISTICLLQEGGRTLR